MKNTFIILAMIFALIVFYCQPGYCSKISKQARGALAILVGVIMTADGFQLSSPKFEYTDISFSSRKSGSTWYADLSGTVKNSGNLDAIDVKITVEYYNAYGTYINNGESSVFDKVAIGQQIPWSILSVDCGINEPAAAYYDIEFSISDSTPRYYKNQTEGYFGVGLMLTGLYYCFENTLINKFGKKTHAFFEEHDLNVKFVNQINYLGISLAKRI